MKFQPGTSGNPTGRPKGSVGGRAQALLDLDEVMNRDENRAALREAIQLAMRTDPLRFFRDIVMPLMPREAKVRIDNDGVIEWKSLLGDEPGETPRFDAEGRLLPGGDGESGKSDQ